MNDPFSLERAAAAAWPAAHAQEREGWLLRASPGVPHRRNNSALWGAARGGERPGAAGGGAWSLAPVEAFYSARGADALVAVAPLEHLRDLDAELARRGWTGEGATDVLVADSASLRLPEPAGVEPVDPLAWPDEAIRTQVLPRARDEALAFAEGQRGAVLCIRSGDVAGVFRLHVAPGERRAGVAQRLLAACARTAPILYAQVETDNAPARRLFVRAGFRRSHGYHYRRLSR